MGEYARHRHSGETIKIGTCEDAFYLRVEDAHLLDKLPGNVDPATTPGLRFRLPYPDEDGILPGRYEDFDRTLRLYRTVERKGARTETHDYAPDYLANGDNLGRIQLRHEPSGLLLSVPCHHGTRLPEPGPDQTVHWNGKTAAIGLYAVKRQADGSIVPITRCMHCGRCWRDTWADVLPYVPGAELRARLARHQGRGQS